MPVPVQQWEYHVLHASYAALPGEDAPLEARISILNEEGMLGWELVSVIPAEIGRLTGDGNILTHEVLYFKRHIPLGP